MDTISRLLVLIFVVLIIFGIIYLILTKGLLKGLFEKVEGGSMARPKALIGFITAVMNIRPTVICKIVRDENGYPRLLLQSNDSDFHKLAFACGFVNNRETCCVNMINMYFAYSILDPVQGIYMLMMKGGVATTLSIKDICTMTPDGIRTDEAKLSDTNTIANAMLGELAYHENDILLHMGKCLHPDCQPGECSIPDHQLGKWELISVGISSNLCVFRTTTVTNSASPPVVRIVRLKNDDIKARIAKEVLPKILFLVEHGAHAILEAICAFWFYPWTFDSEIVELNGITKLNTIDSNKPWVKPARYFNNTVKQNWFEFTHIKPMLDPRVLGGNKFKIFIEHLHTLARENQELVIQNGKINAELVIRLLIQYSRSMVYKTDYGLTVNSGEVFVTVFKTNIENFRQHFIDRYIPSIVAHYNHLTKAAAYNLMSRFYTIDHYGIEDVRDPKLVHSRFPHYSRAIAYSLGLGNGIKTRTPINAFFCFDRDYYKLIRTALTYANYFEFYENGGYFLGYYLDPLLISAEIICFDDNVAVIRDTRQEGRAHQDRIHYIAIDNPPSDKLKYDGLLYTFTMPPSETHHMYVTEQCLSHDGSFEYAKIFTGNSKLIDAFYKHGVTFDVDRTDVEMKCIIPGDNEILQTDVFIGKQCTHYIMHSLYRDVSIDELLVHHLNETPNNDVYRFTFTILYYEPDHNSRFFCNRLIYKPILDAQKYMYSYFKPNILTYMSSNKINEKTCKVSMKLDFMTIDDIDQIIAEWQDVVQRCNAINFENYDTFMWCLAMDIIDIIVNILCDDTLNEMIYGHIRDLAFVHDIKYVNYIGYDDADKAKIIIMEYVYDRAIEIVNVICKHDFASLCLKIGFMIIFAFLIRVFSIIHERSYSLETIRDFMMNVTNAILNNEKNNIIPSTEGIKLINANISNISYINSFMERTYANDLEIDERDLMDTIRNNIRNEMYYAIV